MSYHIHYPDSGSGPTLRRFSDSDREAETIGTLEPCDPSDIESDSLAWYLKYRILSGAGEPEAGTVVRIGPRSFACIREHVIAYYHLA